ATAHHAQTVGQVEIVNQHIAQRLHPYINFYQDDWAKYTPMLDFAAGMVEQESTGVSPFFASLGYEPRSSFDWRPLEKDIPATERLNREAAMDRARRMEEIWTFVRSQVVAAQQRQTQQANRKRRAPDFKKDNMVYLSL